MARHAGARAVTICCRPEQTHHLLSIADDGCGMTPETAAASCSIGIIGMRERGGSYLALDDIAVRSQALADPQGLVDGQRGFVVIDEVQLAPDLLRAIKLAVDRDHAPGRFLLTGSANLLGMRTVGETLAGRAAWFELPPFHANLGKRLVKTAKLYASDPGLASYLTGIESWADAVSSGREGALFETWVVGEVRALDRFSSRPSSLCFWRTSAGREVDLVLERGRDVVAIEIKASATVAAADTAALRELRDGLGDRFRLGIVACLARNPVALDRNLCVAPLPSLLGVD